MNKKQRYIACCSDCGIKKYKIVQEACGITISKGVCPICNKEKMIIPASDWAFMEGDDTQWD